MGLKDYTRLYFGGQAITAVWRGSVQVFGTAPTAPGNIAAAYWTVIPGSASGEVTVILSALPSSGGAAITGIVGRIGTGEAFALGNGVGHHVVSGQTPGATIAISIAAINAIGHGPWTDAKTVTVKADVIAAPTIIEPPGISSGTLTGSVLTATTGVWTGAPAVTLQWLRDGAPITGAIAAQYTLTAVDVGATISVRAIATNAGGSAQATSAGIGPVTAPDVFEFDTDIVILAYGQSNEQGQNNSGLAPIDATLDQDSSGRIRRWDATTGADVAAIQPLADWPSLTQKAPLRSFRMAQDLLARQDPSKKIIIVNTAVGGTKLTTGPLGVGGTHYVTTISRMTACLAAFPGARVFLSWTQGEQDANDSVSAANYTTAFTNMLNGIRAVPGAENMQAVIHQMVPERFFGATADLPYRTVIDRAHKLIPLSVPNTIFIGASLGTQISSDPSHFTSPGHRNAGARAAAWLNRISTWQTTVPTTPAAPTVSHDDTITIAMSAPQPPAYVVEYRAAGSTGTWTEQIVFPAVWTEEPSSFTVTVEGTGAREVRLKSRSRAGTSSASTSVTVTDPVPSVSTAPVITGTATVGQTLTATAGGWLDASSVTRQWLRNGAAISGATGLSYTLVAADLDGQIVLQETAINTTGRAETISNTIGPIMSAGAWTVTAGDGTISITSSPISPAMPSVTATGDGTIILSA